MQRRFPLIRLAFATLRQSTFPRGGRLNRSRTRCHFERSREIPYGRNGTQSFTHAAGRGRPTLLAGAGSAPCPQGFPAAPAKCPRRLTALKPSPLGGEGGTSASVSEPSGRMRGIEPNNKCNVVFPSSVLPSRCFGNPPPPEGEGLTGHVHDVISGRQSRNPLRKKRNLSYSTPTHLARGGSPPRLRRALATKKRKARNFPFFILYSVIFLSVTRFFRLRLPFLRRSFPPRPRRRIRSRCRRRDHTRPLCVLQATF